MINSFVLKILIGLAFSGGLAYGIWDYIDTKQDLRESEVVLAGVTTAFGDYATRTEMEVEAYRISTQILSREFQAERNIRDDKFKSIKDRDLDKMAKRKPKAMSRILTGRTSRLLEDLVNASTIKGNHNTTPAAKTRADGATVD